VSGNMAKLRRGAICQTVRGVEIQRHQSGARFRPGSRRSQSSVSGFPNAGQQLLNPKVVSMFGENQFASGADNLISCAFVLQISAN